MAETLDPLMRAEKLYSEIAAEYAKDALSLKKAAWEIPVAVMRKIKDVSPVRYPGPGVRLTPLSPDDNRDIRLWLARYDQEGKAEKSQASSGIETKATKDGFSIILTADLPAGCQLVEDGTRYIPGHEEKKFKVVCGGEIE